MSLFQKEIKFGGSFVADSSVLPLDLTLPTALSRPV